VNMKELFMASGCEILAIRRNIIASRWLKILDLLVLHHLKEFITYQYYLKVKKAKAPLTIKKRKIYKF